MATTETITFEKAVKEGKGYTLHNAEAYEAPSASYKGPSPYADKHTEGPSYNPRDTYLQPSGILEKDYEFVDITPQVGREFPKARLREILGDDDKLKELAITVSRRGVVFFRGQDISLEEQKLLAYKLGKLTGKPATSGLHIHPTAPRGGFFKNDNSGKIDPEVSIIHSEKKNRNGDRFFNKSSAKEWHSDITFEPVPADYSILRIVEPLKTGGDTLWGSGYGLYEKLSPSFRSYLETLTGTYSQPGFKKASEGEYDLYSDTRGAPENIGDELIAIHPIIRTNPVTGWRSVFGFGHHFTSFNGLNEDESSLIKDYLHNTFIASHDLQVRFRWNKNDVAIWDNRSTYHAATFDYLNGDDVRTGVRTVGIGERPYLSKNSTSRRDAFRKSLP